MDLVSCGLSLVEIKKSICSINEPCNILHAGLYPSTKGHLLSSDNESILDSVFKLNVSAIKFH